MNKLSRFFSYIGILIFVHPSKWEWEFKKMKEPQQK